MIHINTWHGTTLVAAYIADDELPEGVVVGRQGNAVLPEAAGAL